jgi:hypothetical protein
MVAITVEYALLTNSNTPPLALRYLLGVVAPLPINFRFAPFVPVSCITTVPVPPTEVNEPAVAAVVPVTVREVNPVSVVLDAPNAIAVEPTVIELLDNAALGIPEKLVPVNVGVFVQTGGVVPPTRTVLAAPIGNNEVAPADVWYGMLPAAPPAIFVALETDPVTLTVTEPVADDTLIFVPASSPVTPVLDIEFVPDMLIPVPAV